MRLEKSLITCSGTVAPCSIPRQWSGLPKLPRTYARESATIRLSARCRDSGTSSTASCRARLAQSSCSRSEEHTSELQSRFDIVCRLLLEKKKHIHLKSYS